MPDVNTPAEPQAGSAGGDYPQPQAGTSTTTPTPQAGAGKTPEDYERMLADLRHENAGHRTKLKKFEEDEAQRTQAQMSELEKAQKQAADLETARDEMAAELYEARVRQDVADLVGKFNFIPSARTIATLLLADDDAIEFEDGRPTNIEKLLANLAKAEPDLVKPQAQQQQQGTPTIPAMNPGRSSIASPGQATPGYIPRLTDPGVWKR